MKQLDVCSANAGRRRQLVVILQHHDIEEMAGIIAAPMYTPSEIAEIDRLRPRARYKGRSYVIAIDRLAYMPRAQVGRPLGSVEASRYEVIKAIDLIFSGF
jgi:hypothetical protein